MNNDQAKMIYLIRRRHLTLGCNKLNRLQLHQLFAQILEGNVAEKHIDQIFDQDFDLPERFKVLVKTFTNAITWDS